jgi:hypothetical protein
LFKLTRNWFLFGGCFLVGEFFVRFCDFLETSKIKSKKAKSKAKERDLKRATI